MKPTESKNIPETETKSSFARRIEVVPSYVTKLVARGLPVTDDGRVKVAEALEWLAANIAQRGAGEGEDGGGETLIAAKLRLLNAQAEIAELEARKRRGEVVDREEARRAVRAFGRAIRDIILAFPNRYGAGIAAELKVAPATLMAALEASLREMLLEGLALPAPYHKPTEPHVMGGDA